MKQNLQLKTSLQLTLTPQLQQSIRLLQLSSLELHHELEKILLENPLLERLDDSIRSPFQLQPDGALFPQPPSAPHEPDDAFRNDSARIDLLHELPELSHLWREVCGSESDQDDGAAQPQLETTSQSLREHLLSQANLNTRCDRDAALLSLLIESLDENGFLNESLEQIHTELPEEFGVEKTDLHFALNFLQNLEPAGVGARTVSECLALQIERLPDVLPHIRQLALTIVQYHLPQFAQREFHKIKKAIACGDQELRAAQIIIRKCQPYPGLGFNKDRTDFITPDVVVTRSKEAWLVQLNQEAIPNLQINSLYANLLKRHGNTPSLQNQLQEARWLIKNLRQRSDTILRVSQAIVERQRSFFTHGIVAVRPLVLREIADKLGLHESTISRVTNQKFMLTPHGIFELKYFFSNHIATEAGGEASSIAIRALIRQLIGAENHTIPLSDNTIVKILGEQGIVIARRTVAKYRDALRIPPVNLRKSL